MPVEYFEIHESVGGKDNYEMMRGSKDRIKKMEQLCSISQGDVRP